MDLLAAWKAWAPSDAPHVLSLDRVLLGSPRSANGCVTHRSWKAVHTGPEFGKPGDQRLHLGLLPQPYFGDLTKATVFVLPLNPGLGPTDYFGEYEIPEYREALLASLRQDFQGVDHPFLFLDPRFAWHAGFDWWHGKLAGVIVELAGTWNVSFSEARRRLANRFATIELLPYHSESFHDFDRWIATLESVRLARAFVHDIVMPRVRRGEAIVIVTRRVRDWNLPECDGVVCYSSQEARAAHLTPKSPGGRAILDHLLRR